MLEAGTEVVIAAAADGANGADTCCVWVVPTWAAARGVLPRM
jgi:hypothetical protein